MRVLQKLEPLAEGEIFKDERLMDTRKEPNQSKQTQAKMPARLAVVPARLLKSQTLACDLILAKHSRSAII